MSKNHKAIEIIIDHYIKSHDLVEVVKCKDCKHYQGAGHYCCFDHCVNDDDFCSDGEQATMNEIRERYGLDGI